MWGFTGEEGKGLFNKNKDYNNKQDERERVQTLTTCVRDLMM